MKKFAILSVVSVLTIGSVFASVAAVGNWTSPEFDGGFMKMRLEMQIHDKDITMLAHCAYADGKTATAQATVPANVTGKSIEVTSAAQNSVAGSGGMDCYVNITPSTMEYTIAGDVLTLIDNRPGAPMPQFTMTRVK